MTSRSCGYSLVELLAVLSILGLLIAGIPRFLALRSGLEVGLAAREVATSLRYARSTAIRLQRKVAVKFRTDSNGVLSFTLYGDGDGDGVLNRDIEAGIDRGIGRTRELRHFGRRVRLGFPEGMVPRDPGDPRRRLDRLQDPIRFNRSDLASFGTLGTSTPGSVFLTDGRHHLFAVRVFGRTGKIRIVRYDAAGKVWR